MKTVITDAGINAAINAGLNGPKISVTKVKIGSTILNPTSDMTDVANEVWSGNVSYIQYQIMDERTFLFKITLDESIGDFDIGNIGLFLEDGTMFCISTLLGIEKKIKNNTPVVGNRKTFEIPIVLSGLSGLINLNLLVPDECSLPFVQTEESLPDPTLAPFSVYEVIYQTELKSPALALRTPTGWYYAVVTSADTGGSFDLNSFAQGIEVGDLVYFDAVSGLFKLADGTDETKGYIGIRGANNTVIYDGIYTNSDYQLTIGANYFAGQQGTLTTVENSFYVGKAVGTHTLMLGVGVQSVSNKTDEIDGTNPSDAKYPSEKAVVTFLENNYAKRDMSNVGDATFNGQITFMKTIATGGGDLAEYYYSDEDYAPGTLVCFGGDKEITKAVATVNAVISDKPGLILNKEEKDNSEDLMLPIALTGRVPVLVEGKVYKFSKLTLSNTPGVARVAKQGEEIIGISLEENMDEGIKKVRCSVKLTF